MLAELFTYEANQFKDELEKWNRVYPNHQGTFIFNPVHGPRLILPCLPGKELGWWLNQITIDDRLTQAKVWLAVAQALSDLANKNLYQNDILNPNILVHREDHDLFKAYVLDFGSVSELDCKTSCFRVCHETEVLTRHPCQTYEEAIDILKNYIASYPCTQSKPCLKAA